MVSYGADGDSKQLRSMKLSTGLFAKSSTSENASLTIVPSLKIPDKWKLWFLLENPTSIAYVQDRIHLAVKLKARLMKTSVILPLLLVFNIFELFSNHMVKINMDYEKKI